MKLIPLLSILLIIISCREPEKNSPGEEVNNLTLPDSFSYNGRKPVWGNIEHVQLIQAWNRKRSSLDTEIKDLIADTLTLHLEDGSEYILNKDSAVTYLGSTYDEYAGQIITINAAIPVHYSDLDHNWVYSWVKREIENENGESNTVYLHEDYRIVNNRIREIYQFKREPPGLP